MGTIPYSAAAEFETGSGTTRWTEQGRDEKAGSGGSSSIYHMEGGWAQGAAAGRCRIMCQSMAQHEGVKTAMHTSRKSLIKQKLVSSECNFFSGFRVQFYFFKSVATNKFFRRSLQLWVKTSCEITRDMQRFARQNKNQFFSPLSPKLCQISRKHPKKLIHGVKKGIYFKIKSEMRGYEMWMIWDEMWDVIRDEMRWDA